MYLGDSSERYVDLVETVMYDQDNALTGKQQTRSSLKFV